MLRFARAGDIIIVHSMDRLARNLEDLRRLVRELTGRGVCVQFMKEQLTFTAEDSPMATLLLSVLGAFAGVRAGADPGAPGRGNRAGPGARCLPGPQALLEQRPGRDCPGPCRGRGAQGEPGP